MPQAAVIEGGWLTERGEPSTGAGHPRRLPSFIPHPSSFIRPLSLRPPVHPCCIGVGLWSGYRLEPGGVLRDTLAA